MRIINLEIHVDRSKLIKPEQDFWDQIGFIGIFESLLLQGIQSLHPQGLPVVKGKILARIQQRIEDATKSATTLTVEDAEYDLIKSVFLNEQTTFQPQQYRVVTKFIELVEKAEVVK